MRRRAHADPDPKCGACSYSNELAHPNSDSHAHHNARPNAYPNPDSHTLCDAHPGANRNSDSHTHHNAYPNPDSHTLCDSHHNAYPADGLGHRRRRLWRDVVGAFTETERSCIQAELGAEAYDDLLARAVLGGEVWPAGFPTGCLTEETAIDLSIGLVAAAGGMGVDAVGQAYADSGAAPRDSS